jgi:hypothetical protein
MKKFIEISTDMKGVIWIGVKGKTSPCIKVCISFRGGITPILQKSWRVIFFVERQLS